MLGPFKTGKKAGEPEDWAIGWCQTNAN
jgi:hypothetical protein